jgi:DNA polymerase-1
MRQGSNQRIQSTSADMTKLAMVKIYRQLDKKRARIVLTVHDEIIIEATEAYTEKARSIMKSSMESAAQELLPRMGQYVRVDVNVTDRYDK